MRFHEVFSFRYRHNYSVFLDKAGVITSLLPKTYISRRKYISCHEIRLDNYRALEKFKHFVLFTTSLLEFEK